MDSLNWVAELKNKPLQKACADYIRVLTTTSMNRDSVPLDMPDWDETHTHMLLHVLEKGTPEEFSEFVHQLEVYRIYRLEAVKNNEEVMNALRQKAEHNEGFRKIFEELSVQMNEGEQAMSKEGMRK